MRENGGNYGMLDVLRLKAEAWKTRQAAEAELVILEYRKKLALARLETEKVEAELEMHRTLRRLGLEVERAVIQHQIEMEKLLGERDRLRQQRLEIGRLPAVTVESGAAFPPPVPALPAPTVEPDITDRQVEVLALRALNRFATLPEAEARAAWTAWARELQRRFPPNAAAEIGARARELLELSR